jgi:DNA-binding response OmpR family regulator
MPNRYRAEEDPTMPFLALLSDRSPDVALPALLEVAPDLKLEPLSLSSLQHALELEPEAILVDAGENAPQAWSVLTELRARDARIPAAVVLERDQLERYPWHEVADELVYPGAPAAELRVRLAMLRRRAGAGDGTVIRLGDLSIDTETFHVTVS